MRHYRNRPDNEEVDKRIIETLRTNYVVDLEVGDIFSKETGKPLARCYNGRTPYPRVRIWVGNKQYLRGLDKLLWMVSRGRPVPPGFDIHHDDHNHENRNYKNLICIYGLDHNYHHARFNGDSEQVPF